MILHVFSMLILSYESYLGYLSLALRQGGIVNDFFSGYEVRRTHLCLYDVYSWTDVAIVSIVYTSD